jgi:hypothetical protein
MMVVHQERGEKEMMPTSISTKNIFFARSVLIQGSRARQGVHLVELMWMSMYCETFDPRDKVFGLLGMTNWSRSGNDLPSGIQPNYRQSQNICMRNATRVMIEEKQDLAVLMPARKKRHLIDEEIWPSWTPVWHEMREFWGLLLLITMPTTNAR